MTVIPELPETYISDRHLKSFLKLLIEGLSEVLSLHLSINCCKNHQLLQVETDINAAAYVYWEREYLDIVESIVCKNVIRLERVMHEVLAKWGWLMKKK